jgi:hypothetical protein
MRKEILNSAGEGKRPYCETARSLLFLIVGAPDLRGKQPAGDGNSESARRRQRYLFSCRRQGPRKLRLVGRALPLLGQNVVPKYKAFGWRAFEG